VKDYTDSEIIECLRMRQGYVVKYLSDRYLPMVRLMVTQKGGSIEDAKDVFQDALIIMLEKIDNKDFVVTCKFKTFLYSVCENLWKMVLVKRQAANNYISRRLDSESEIDFTELSDNSLYETLFWDVFETIDESSKKILKLYWQEMSPQDIADKLGLTNGYVRKKKSEAQALLTERVKKHPEYKRLMNSGTVAIGS
jgi:RNA polymerase sigma factor (sigma-70 family)